MRGQSVPADEYFEVFLSDFHRRQREELLVNGIDELLVVAARKIGAADRTLEQHVADDQKLRGFVIEDHMPGRMSGAVKDVQFQLAHRHGIAVVEPAIRRKGTGARHAEALALLAGLVDPELVFRVRSLDRQRQLFGKHAGHASVRANDGGTPLRADEETIASLLKEKGYATGGFGKWGCGGRDSTGVPEKHGFDVFFGYYDQVHAHSFYPPYLIRNSEEVHLQYHMPAVVLLLVWLVYPASSMVSQGWGSSLSRSGRW